MRKLALLATLMLLAMFRITPQVSAQDTATKSLSITVNVVPLTISPSTLPQGMVGLVYTTSVSAAGGLAPYSFSVSAGSLPTGVTLSSGGAFGGTPTASGPATFTVKVTDSETTPLTATQSYTVNILSTLSITTTSLPAANIGVAYTTTLAATGGQSPYTFAVTTGSLPTGLTLSTSGTISGTPSVAGTFNFTITVTDSATNVVQVFVRSIIVAENQIKKHGAV